MIKTGVSIEGISYTREGKEIVRLICDYRISEYLDDLKDKKITMELKETKGKRSLNANSYYWSLANKLAEKLNKSNEEVHFELLKSYSDGEVVSIVSTVNPQGYFKYFEEIGESTLNCKVFKHYKIYKGSSEMDTKEMARLIDGTIEECKAQGIQVLSPHEILLLKENWKNEKV